MVAAALSTFVGCVRTYDAFDHTQRYVPYVCNKPNTHMFDRATHIEVRIQSCIIILSLKKQLALALAIILFSALAMCIL